MAVCSLCVHEGNAALRTIADPHGRKRFGICKARYLHERLCMCSWYFRVGSKGYGSRARGHLLLTATASSGTLLVFAGPSAAGKGTIRGELVQDGYPAVICCSTRLPRVNDGFDILAGVNPNAFKALEMRRALILCHTPYGTDRYGISRASLDGMLALGGVVHTELPPALLQSEELPREAPHVLKIGLWAQLDELRERLALRRANDVDRRMKYARAEIDQLHELRRSGILDLLIYTGASLDECLHEVKLALPTPMKGSRFGE
jgi:guanylate kinase